MFSLSGALHSLTGYGKKDDPSSESLSPSLKVQTDKEIYRPGDFLIAVIEVSNPNEDFGLLVENLTFEIKGIEKLDPQWFATKTPFPGSKLKRGENIFLHCSTPSIISKLKVSSGGTKTYMVQTELPKVIPPSYRGAAIRYLYYVRSTLCGHWLSIDDGHSEIVKNQIQLEVHLPLQIWVTQKTSGLLTEGQNDGIFPSTAIQLDVYWKEKDGDSEWVRANEVDEVDEGYDSSRDEISSVSSYKPPHGNLNRAFRSSLSLYSQGQRASNKDQHFQGERLSLSSNTSLPQLSATEVLYDSNGAEKRHAYSPTVLFPSQQRVYANSHLINDDMGIPSTPGAEEASASEGFVRGRSYNIRMDQQVLLRFSPKNSDSTYYFGDMIGGTLTFFHEEGARRCLEVSITLETSETIIQPSIHSRKSSTITKVQSDHYEVVVDLMQTSFLFSIPMDGPMSFSTPHVSVRWALHFEFFTTPKNVDWTRYDHPLLIEGREKCEWILPLTVHAPPPRAQTSRNEKLLLSLGELWVRT